MFKTKKHFCQKSQYALIVFLNSSQLNTHTHTHTHARTHACPRMPPAASVTSSTIVLVTGRAAGMFSPLKDGRRGETGAHGGVAQRDRARPVKRDNAAFRSSECQRITAACSDCSSRAAAQVTAVRLWALRNHPTVRSCGWRLLLGL